IPSPLDIAQRDGLARELGTDCATEKLLLMEEPDFAEIARVVAQHDTLADIGGEDRIDIAHALEVHAIRLDFPRFGDRQEEQVELLQGFRHARYEAALLPALLRRDLGFAVRPGMVLAQEVAEAAL